MNMKRIVFKIANHFALALLHCCSLVVVLRICDGKRKESTVIIDIKQNGLVMN